VSARLDTIALVVALASLLASLRSTEVRAAEAPDAAALRLFDEKIHPVLAGTCFRCHGDQKVAGELRVDSRAALIAGGDSGPALVPGQPEESPLLKAIERADDVSAMPPDGALRADQVAAFASWIKAGAPWPEKAARFESSHHWAYEPVRSIEPPAVRDESWVRTPIDHFVLARLEAASSAPLPPADRRTLIRRATYDLTGLPPSPAEVEQFVKDDAPDAYDKLLDRLLTSRQHGEQWGRHWLDIVRYADTAGENSDHPLPHAWRYRNWVMRAFERDMPYDEFIRQQVAGDLLAVQGPAEEYADRVIATGYLAIARRFGHDIEKDVHLTLEDTLDTLGKSVLGLSLGCCRCHDHKYDPLTTRDYYGLYGIFDSTKFSYPGCEPKQLPRDLVPLVSPAEYARLVQGSVERLPEASAEIKRLTDAQSAETQRLKPSLAASARLLSARDVDDGQSEDIAQGAQTSLENVVVRRGEVLQLSITPRGNHGADSTLVDLEIDEIGGAGRRWNTADLLADLTAGNPHPDGFGHPAAWCFLDLRDGPAFLPESLTAIDGHAELRAWRNGETPSVFVNTADEPVKVWTTLPPRQFFMHPGPNGAVALAWLSPLDGTITIRGRVADAHSGGDGVAFQVVHYADPQLSGALVSLGEMSKQLNVARRERDALQERDRQIPRGFAVAEGEPHNARIQLRGEPQNLGDEVPRKFIDFLGGQQVTDAKSSGRRELAEWLTAPQNPLTARVMVNRVWQWHFGRGLVKTPNDFGFRGAPPTHPELLDYLAHEFIKSGWSVRALDRLIMSSAVYQQASSGMVDDLYRGFARRRLTAEELRDTLLAASGELDMAVGEAHPFPPESSWSFTQHGPFSAEYETQKRSVYVMQKRNRRTRFFALFDGADPNASTPLRDITTVPTQALFFLNDPFLHERAAKFSERVVASAATEAERAEFAYRQLFGRGATQEERDEALEFVKQFSQAGPANAAPSATEQARAAWGALARVLFASNEFLHID